MRRYCIGGCTCRTAYRYLAAMAAARYPAPLYTPLAPFRIETDERDRVEVRLSYYYYYYAQPIHSVRLSGVVSI